MTISGSVTLDDRTIRSWGVITWEYAELTQTIAMSGSALIDIDGGRFETFNVTGLISADFAPNSRIVVSNSGAFVRNNTEVAGTITIRARLENNGGITEFAADTTFTLFSQTLANSVSVFGSGVYQFDVFENNGGSTQFAVDTTFTRFTQTLASAVSVFGGAVNQFGVFENNGGRTEFAGNATFARYSQTLANSVSVFGSGVYEFDPNAFTCDGGTISLAGGNLKMLAGRLRFTNTTISGYGVCYSSFETNDCLMTLSGDFRVQRFDAVNTPVFLQGNTFRATSGLSRVNSPWNGPGTAWSVTTIVFQE